MRNISSEPTYYEYGRKAGEQWAEEHLDASPDDVAREQMIRMERMISAGFPKEANEAWAAGFFAGAAHKLS